MVGIKTWKMLLLVLVVVDWLLEMDTSLLLWFLMLPNWLHTRMMINFDWLSYLRFMLTTTHTTLNTDHMTGFKWRIQA